MCSLFNSIVYLTLDTFPKVGRAFILSETHGIFTVMVKKGSDRLGENISNSLSAESRSLGYDSNLQNSLSRES